MRYRAVLLDLDDTLIIEQQAAEEAFLATCRRVEQHCGVAADTFHRILRQRARSLWHASDERDTIERISISHWEGLWARFEGDDPALVRLRRWARRYQVEAWRQALGDIGIDDPDWAARLSRTFQDERRRRHHVFPETPAVLRRLRGRVRLGLITNGLSCLQREKIRGTGLEPFFDTVTIAGDIGVAKPDPTPFRVTLEALGVSPEQAVMVGNSVRGDIGGAQAVGLTAVLVDRGAIHGADPTIEPDHTIGSLAELPTWLGLDDPAGAAP